jgi:hypothetical protein
MALPTYAGVRIAGADGVARFDRWLPAGVSIEEPLAMQAMVLRGDGFEVTNRVVQTILADGLGEGACGDADLCVTEDGDGDGVSDRCDPCPADNPDDADGDGFCGAEPCADGDGDGVCDLDDLCPGDDLADDDGDGVCDGLDACPGDDFADSDGDTVCDGLDACPGDDFADADGDEICDGLDPCPLHPSQIDFDEDGTPDACDETPYADLIPASMGPYVTMRAVTLPDRTQRGGHSYGTWEVGALNPRSFHDQIADGRVFVGWTADPVKGRVSIVDGDDVVTYNMDNREVHGIVAHDDGSFATLNRGVDLGTGELTMYLTKYLEDGSVVWESNLNDGASLPAIELAGGNKMGDARLTYGAGLYAAYYTVQNFGGHHGDKSVYVDEEGTVDPTRGWGWGCSHSMSELISYNPALDGFMAACVSDTYPGYGVFSLGPAGDKHVYESGSNEAGLVSAVLGQLAPSSTGWMLAFNASERPCCLAHGPAVQKLDEDGNPIGEVKWMLPEGIGTAERDVALGRLGTHPHREVFLMGWRDTDIGEFFMTMIDRDGEMLMPVENIYASGGAFWGRRDDSFRTEEDGSISWIFAPQLSTTLYIGHIAPPF